MAFLTPLLLLFGLLAIPIVVMYMLRLRRQEVVVSSTMLWNKLTRDREANALWQKLRRNLLMFLQLFILALLVLALARPFLRIPSVVNRSVVVLLDGSPSMQATDTADVSNYPTRFDAAKDEVNRLIRSLAGGNQMTIIQVGAVPKVLAAATGDKNRLFDVIELAEPDSAPADWAAAFALASGAAQGFRDARVIIVSDGGLPADLPPLPPDTAYVPVGVSGENLSISALATRRGEGKVELFTAVTNHGRVNQNALLSIGIDGQLFDARELFVPAGETIDLTWDLAEDISIAQAALSSAEFDHLAIDNTAIAVHEGGISSRALLVTDGNIFIEQIFSVLPGVESFKTPANTDLTESVATNQFDLYVFDGASLPDPLPAADMLIINPLFDTRPDALIGVSGIVTGTQNTAAIRLTDSPLLQFVDWSGINIRQMKQIDAPWATTLVEAAEGPLILTGERNGQRIAILSFDLRDSDLPLQITFPILMSNLTDWLNPGRAFRVPNGLQPGDVVPLVAAPTSSGIVVQKPDQTTWTTPILEGEILFSETDEPGLYVVGLVEGETMQPVGAFAVNLFAPQESTLLPAEGLTLGAIEIAAGTGDDVGQYEFWIWLAAIAFAVLLIEWWIFHRGTRLPQFGKISIEPLLNRLRNSS
ncbi:MAG: Ca-activated chloride channel family protein [Cellvibrionaceae bacterium]|jgi:Ca-activated chloride channel family protein